jgi:hypothetical protein
MIYLEPLGQVGGPIILLDSQQLYVYGLAHPIQIVGNGFDSSWVVPTFRGALSVRLVIDGIIVVIVPLIMSILLNALMLLAPVVNPNACISTADDIAQISVISIPPSATFLQWSETTSRVPARTMSVVKLMTQYFAITVEYRVHHACCIQHRLEALYMCNDFIIIFRQVGCELVDELP